MKLFRRLAHVLSILTLLGVSQARPLQAETEKRNPARTNQQPATPTVNVTVAAPQKSSDELESERNNATQQIAIQKEIARYTEWLVVVGFLDVVAIAFGLGYTARAANAAKENARQAARAATTAKKTLLLTQRADIQLAKSFWDPKLVGLQDFPRATFNLKFKNFGPTSARRATFDFTLGIPDTKVATHFGPSVAIDVAPGQVRPFGFSPMEKIMGPHELSAVAMGQRPMRYWGTVTYTDVFDDRHITTIEGTYIPGTAAFRVDRNDTVVERRSK